MTARKGFTLIELLIVIAILGVLAAGVVAAINPTKRMNQANDSKVKNDVSQISTAMQAYFTTNGYYASDLADLETSEDLKKVPVPPTATGYGAAYTLSVSPAGCTTALKTCTNVAIGGTLKAPIVPANVTYCYKSSTGVSAELPACAAP